jgi:hypothetical protein
MSIHQTSRAQPRPTSIRTLHPIRKVSTSSCRVDIFMSWVNKAYGYLRMGRRLLHSSCDFFALPQETPTNWHLA